MEELAISRIPRDSKVKSSTKSERSSHPYLSGNYWPQEKQLHLQPCEVDGTLPKCLRGGQFVRNGPNAALPPEQGQNYHMFDGDGMIHGVYFRARPGSDDIETLYVNKFVHTDVYLASNHWGTNLLPSIASLIDPLTSTLAILKSVMRSGAIAFLSGSTRLSTANTALVYHDRRLLATCESGPPMHVGLPELETVDWHTFTDSKTHRSLAAVSGSPQEWITGHPKVDPVNGDLVMFGYDIFQLSNPYIRFSVIDAHGSHKVFQERVHLNSDTPKMMHDFAITQTHAVILDLPLTMSPFNIVRGGKPMLHFNPRLTSKFGVLPRTYKTAGGREQVKWFETESCMIFHTVNAWDEYEHRHENEDGDDGEVKGDVVAVCLVACRFKGAKLVYAAGAITMAEDEFSQQEDVVHLYYYRFDLRTGSVTEYPLSDFPIEYPSINTGKLSLRNRYAYGASMRQGSFDTALSGAKVDVLVKCDLHHLISHPPRDVTQASSNTPPRLEGVKSIILPPNYYASEATFVANEGAKTEDDGVILVHIFNESTLLANGDAQNDRGSEIWIIDAQTFALPPICRIRMPQRVPYGLHGLWVPQSQILQQRGTTVRETASSPSSSSSSSNNGGGTGGSVLSVVRDVPGTRQRTSVSTITSFWKWNAVWVGKSTVHSLSSGRYAVSLLLAWGIFCLLSYRSVLFLWYVLTHA